MRHAQYPLRLLVVSATTLATTWFMAYVGATPYLRWVFPWYLALGPGLVFAMCWGPAVWPGLLVGGYLLRILRLQPEWSALVGGLADVAGVLVTWYLIRRGTGYKSHMRTALSVLWAGLAGACAWGAISITIRLPANLPYVHTMDLASRIFMALTTASAPIIVSAQLVVAFRDLRVRGGLAILRGRVPELAALLAVMSGAVTLVMLTPLPPILIFIPLVWSVVRFHKSVSATCLVLVVLGMSTAARMGWLDLSPTLPAAWQFAALQAFNLTALTMVLVFGSVVADLDAAAQELDEGLGKVVQTLDQASPLQSLRYKYNK